jgi:hypothetical protein
VPRDLTASVNSAKCIPIVGNPNRTISININPMRKSEERRCQISVGFTALTAYTSERRDYTVSESPNTMIKHIANKHSAIWSGRNTGRFVKPRQ